MNIEPLPADSACKRDSSNRAVVTLLCEVRQGIRPWTMVRLEDLSQNGFRIARFPNCSRELPLRIRIPGMQLLTAQVRWQQGRAIGCAFAEPLHIAVFEHLIRQARLDA